jgi:hypothetical protein
MSPEKYVKRFRILAAISWIGIGILVILLMLLSIVPRTVIFPLIAVAIGTLPVLLFKLFSKVECPRCKYKMKVHSRFPHLIYKCVRCSHVVNTNVYRNS